MRRSVRIKVTVRVRVRDRVRVRVWDKIAFLAPPHIHMPVMHAPLPCVPYGPAWCG